MKNIFFASVFLCSNLILPLPIYAKCGRHKPVSINLSDKQSFCRPCRIFISESCRKSRHHEKCSCVVSFPLLKIFAYPEEKTSPNTSRSFSIKIENLLNNHLALVLRTTDFSPNHQNSINLHLLYCVWIE